MKYLLRRWGPLGPGTHGPQGPRVRGPKKVGPFRTMARTFAPYARTFAPYARTFASYAGVV